MPPDEPQRPPTLEETPRIRRLDLGSIAIRAAEDGDGRTIEGIAVPWDGAAVGTLEYGMRAERFQPGSFRRALELHGERPIPFLDRHDGIPVGAVRMYEAPDGLRYHGRLLTSQRAIDYAETVAAGVDGVSLEFLPGTVNPTRDGVIHTDVRRIGALAGAYAPAFIGARAAVRDIGGSQMPPEITPETIPAVPAPPAPLDPAPAPGPDPAIEPIARAIIRSELDLFRRQIATPAAAVDEWSAVREIHRLGALYLASRDAVDDGMHGLEVRRAFARALDDQITGDSAGVMTPGVIQEVKGIVNAGRPAQGAFGTEGLPSQGMTVDWPFLETVTLSDLVAAQPTGEKNEIVSAEVHFDKGSANLITYAGGADISYQLLRRSSPSYLDAWARLMLAAWAFVTDSAFVTAIEGAATGAATLDTSSADQEEIQLALLTASVAVKAATGQPAGFILASDEMFLGIGSKLTPAPIFNALGTAVASTLQISASGLPLIHDPSVAAGTAIVSNGLAARWHEDGPFPASEEDVAKLGRNVAYWGMGAGAVYLPAGIVILSAS